MIIYNLETKKRIETFSDDSIFALIRRDEVNLLPSNQKDILSKQKDNLRPVIHHKNSTIYTFRIYQMDLKAVPITLMSYKKHIYLISDALEDIHALVPELLEEDNFISALIKYFLDDFYTIFSDYEDKLIALEDSLSSGSFTNVSLDSLSKMKHNAMMAEKNMRRIQYIIMNILEKNSDLGHLHGLVLNDVDYARHIVDYVNHLIILYNSLISEKTNNTISKLTVLAFLTSPVSMLSGIYGMNFISMPGIYNKYGFYIIVAITFLSMTIVYLLIKKFIDKRD